MKISIIPCFVLLSFQTLAQPRQIPGTYVSPNLLTTFKNSLLYVGDGHPWGVDHSLWQYNGIDSPYTIEGSQDFANTSLAPDNSYRIASDGAHLYFPARSPSAVWYHTTIFRWYGYDAPVPLNNSIDNYNPRYLCVLNNKLYAVMDSVGAFSQLWEYDLSTDEGRRLTNFNPFSSAGAHINDIVAFKDKIYFDAAPEKKDLLMEYDPVTGKMDIVPSDMDLLSPNQFLVTDEKLFFVAFIKVQVSPLKFKNQLCMYDGKNPVAVLTSFTTDEVNISGGSAIFNNKIYFLRNNTSYPRIWSYDIKSGVVEQVQPLKNIAVNRIFKEYHGKLYFSGHSSTGQGVLYSFDGDHEPKVIDYDILNPTELVELNGKIYFTAYDSASKESIYSYYEEDSPKIVTTEGTLYPNPSSGFTTMTFHLNKELPLSFIITDMSGSVVHREPLKNYQEGQNSITFQTGSLPAGVYNCTVASENNHAIMSKKLSKR